MILRLSYITSTTYLPNKKTIHVYLKYVYVKSCTWKLSQGSISWGSSSMNHCFIQDPDRFNDRNYHWQICSQLRQQQEYWKGIIMPRWKKRGEIIGYKSSLRTEAVETKWSGGKFSFYGIKFFLESHWERYVEIFDFFFHLPKLSHKFQVVFCHN